MKTIERKSGVSLTVPEDVDVVVLGAGAVTRAARPAAARATPESERVLGALQAADFEVVDRVALKRGAPPRTTTRGTTRTASGKRSVQVEVPVKPSQSAVLLVEEGGMYRFVLPPAKPRTRAATRAVAGTIVFDVELGARPARRAGVTRGRILDAVLGEVRTYVLRFAADLVIKGGVKYLERNVQRGFVDMRAKDPGKWSLLASLDALGLPDDRPPRILLFVHGTFSSTVGGFAALRGSPWGNALLDAAGAKYDAIVGFDHPTLSVDPRVNAQALLDALMQHRWKSPPAIDIVAHSRGGLVTRSLVEELLPPSKLKAAIGTIVFVACTNEGTLLAEPDNWKDLVDLYTNLVVVGCRVLEAFGYTTIAAVVVEEVVRLLGLFLKLLVSAAVTDKAAPGIAAMEPDGKFVTNINKTQPGQPTPAQAEYYVVQSDFALRLLGKDGPSEFTERFKLWLADGFIDKLMKKARNDLVVNVSSMGAIDVAAGKFVKATYDFGTNAQVYHTNYFTRPETTQAMGGWLGVLPPPAAPRVMRIARSMRAAKPSRVPTTRDLARRIGKAPSGKVAQPASANKAAKKASPFGTMRSSPSIVDTVGRVYRFNKRTEPPVKAEKFTCHFRAEMDDAIVVNTNADVAVTLSREAIDKALGPAQAQGDAPVEAGKKLSVRIIPKQNVKVVGDDAKEVDPPSPRRPVQLAFKVSATDLGDGEVWVSIQQAHVVLATLKLFPKIVREVGKAARRKSAKGSAGVGEVESTPINQLMIEELVNGDEVKYHYTFLSESLEVRSASTSKPIRGDREQYVAKLYKDIETRWLASRRDAADFAKELRAFGADLFDQLVPPELQKILWDHRDEIKSIQVVSTEPFIPWELVHLRNPGRRGMPAETRFLGEMGLIRWVQGIGKNGWPVKRIKIRDGKAYSVVPDYPVEDMALPSAAAEADFLERRFGAKPLPAESGKVRAFISRPGKFDLLHFVCHGEADPATIADARLLMTGRIDRSNGEENYIEDPFTAKVASQYCNIEAKDNAPMVILNACQVGRQGYQLTSIGGFAEAFLKGGAGAFIGALWSVGDAPASTFTIELYEQMLASRTLSEATIAGREAARKKRDATWLAYVVYGHPYMTITR